MEAPLVSIIIPCFNAAPCLADSVESCLRQTYANIELIIVDDGSTDESKAIARAFTSRKVTVVAQANVGNGAARNRGLASASGDFIQYLDADDILDARKIEIQVERLLHDGIDCLASGAWVRFSDDLDAAVFSPDPIWKDLSPIDWICTSWDWGGMMASHAWLMHKSLALAIGPWDEELCRNVDGEYFTRAVLASRRVLFCGDAKVYYRTVPVNTVSRNRTRKGLQDTLRSVELSVRHFLDSETSDRTRAAAAALYQQFVYDAYIDEPDLAEAAERRVEQLGGCNRPLREGLLFDVVADAIGWKAARHLQHAYRRMRYGSRQQTCS
jgi:glycosyltransferase involved in cell wall biosynthesis